MLVGGGIGSIVIALIYMFLGGNPSDILNQQTTDTQSSSSAPVGPQPDDQAAKFTRVILASTEDVWTKQFADQGSQYRDPTLVMFRQVTQSGCGTASESSGPFYCPTDQKVYIDLSFYDELAKRFQAPGDFAMAYVVAHEIGHHVQKQLGIMDKIDEARSQMSEVENNRLSVRLELQADFLAGVWAHYAQQQNKDFIDASDIQEALTAASAIGDDRIQEETQGRVVPDAFTHGTSKQRAYWFTKGFKTGDIKQGDTFNSREDSNL